MTATINERKELAVVTAFFTPEPHNRRRRNFEIFSRQFAQSLYVAELAFDGLPWITAPGPNSLHVRGQKKHLMWQKERLLNAMIARLPKSVTHVAWVDSDILFLDRDWPSRALERLKEFPVIQLFDSASHLDEAGRPILQGPSITASAAKYGHAAYVEKRGTPGFAWAARRELLEQLPLLDVMIVGGADTYMATGFAGAECPGSLVHLPLRLQRAVTEWTNRAKALTSGKVGCLTGAIGHLFHGPLQTRGYLERYQLLRQADFDPMTDVAVDENGLYAWKTTKKGLHMAVADYFAYRAKVENV